MDCGFVFRLETPQTGLAVTHTNKTALLLTQSSLSQSVKAAQITETVIQLKPMHNAHTDQFAISTSCLSAVVGAKEASSENKGKSPDWPPLPKKSLLAFPQSCPDVTGPFRHSTGWFVHKAIPVVAVTADSSSGDKRKVNATYGACATTAGSGGKRGSFCFPVS